MATIRDVAKEAGVSVATVSRVINEKGYVHKDTKRKVLDAIRKLNFQPNPVARGLASKKTGTIAVILPDIMNPFFSTLARAVEDTARSMQYTVIFCNSDDQRPKEQDYIRILQKKYIDGIIFASHHLQEKDVAYMRENEIPFIVLDRAPTQKGCQVIRVNNFKGAVIATEHLLEIGCQKIAHIAGPQSLLTARERLNGYLETVKDLPWFQSDFIVESDFSLEGGKQAALRLITNHPDVDGIFVGNDLMAIGVLKTLFRLGYRVPEDIAVCGFDGIELTEMTEPELTTIVQPIYELGKMAVVQLLDQIKGKKTIHSYIELDVHLVQRASTRRSVSSNVKEAKDCGSRKFKH
jgi:LacI family transcriptional regulator